MELLAIAGTVYAVSQVLIGIVMAIGMIFEPKPSTETLERAEMRSSSWPSRDRPQ